MLGSAISDEYDLPVMSELLTKTVKFDSRELQQSVRLYSTTLEMPNVFPRSTCHHGLGSFCVLVTELLLNTPLVLPSTALDAGGLEARAGLVDVVDAIGQVAEEAPLGVWLGVVPVVGELDLGCVAGGAGAQEHQRELALGAVFAAQLFEA